MTEKQTPQIVNVSIFDGAQPKTYVQGYTYPIRILGGARPKIYVQRYIYPLRTYLVLRKAETWDAEREGPFRPDPAYDGCFWSATPILSAEYPEILAEIYDEKDNSPVNDLKDVQYAEPDFFVAYDHERNIYTCETSLPELECVEQTVAHTLQEAIVQALSLWHDFCRRSIEGL